MFLKLMAVMLLTMHPDANDFAEVFNTEEMRPVLKQAAIDLEISDPLETTLFGMKAEYRLDMRTIRARRMRVMNYPSVNECKRFQPPQVLLNAIQANEVALQAAHRQKAPVGEIVRLRNLYYDLWYASVDVHPMEKRRECLERVRRGLPAGMWQGGVLPPPTPVILAMNYVDP